MTQDNPLEPNDDSLAPNSIDAVFSKAPDGRVVGSVTRDSLRRRKIVFVDEKGESAKASSRFLPRAGERWECELVRDTSPDPTRGALIVKPQRFLDRSFDTRCGGRLIVDKKQYEFIEAQAEVLDVLEEAIASLELPADGSFLSTEVDLGRPLDRHRCLPVAKATLDDKVTFGQRYLRKKPSRVIVGEPGAEVSVVTIIARPMRNRSRYQNTYGFITAYIGPRAPAEPWSTARDSAKVVWEAWSFWRQHALIYDRHTMEPTFESTWREVLGPELAARIERVEAAIVSGGEHGAESLERA